MPQEAEAGLTVKVNIAGEDEDDCGDDDIDSIYYCTCYKIDCASAAQEKRQAILT